MAKSECICEHFSCETPPSLEKNERFRFVKEKGVITSQIVVGGITYRGGPCSGDISNCEIREMEKVKN